MRRELALALLLDLIGAGAVLLIAPRHWQSVTLERAGRPPVTLAVTGRTLDGAPTALAVAALAAVVALLATRGLLRRVIGLALAAVGVVVLWRSLAGASAVSAAHARDLVAARHPASVDGAVRIAVHSGWAWASAVAAAAVLAAGLLVTLRGHRWQGMSARYEAPAVDDETARARADLSMWNALDRGDDPTS